MYFQRPAAGNGLQSFYGFTLFNHLTRVIKGAARGINLSRISRYSIHTIHIHIIFICGTYIHIIYIEYEKIYINIYIYTVWICACVCSQYLCISVCLFRVSVRWKVYTVNTLWSKCTSKLKTSKGPWCPVPFWFPRLNAFILPKHFTCPGKCCWFRSLPRFPLAPWHRSLLGRWPPWDPERHRGEES